MFRCPRCRNRPLTALEMIGLPNSQRERIVCRACGELLERRPMRGMSEACVVWMAVMAPALPLVVVGGSIGFGVTICLVLLLLWVAPWQGLTYALPPAAARAELPIARMARLPPAPRPADGGGDPPALDR